MGTIMLGLVVVGLSAMAAAMAVLVWRRLDLTSPLEADSTLITNTYPIIGLIYGVFLGFTIVITWGHFQDAEMSTTQEATRLSELWRDSQVLPAASRRAIQCVLYSYASAVIELDWPSMADTNTRHPGATAAYERIWDEFYAIDGDSLDAGQMAFFQEAIGQLNELGRERRQRGLYAGGKVQPLVSGFLIGGGIITVLFSLLIPAVSAKVHLYITALLAALIGFSIFLALALERPFSGELSVSPEAFESVRTSFEARLASREPPETCL